MSKIKTKNISNILIKASASLKISAILSILFFCFISSTNAQSQKYNVSGKILEESDNKQLVGMEFVTVLQSDIH